MEVGMGYGTVEKRKGPGGEGSRGGEVKGRGAEEVVRR